jgi:hypothetical protein
LYSVGDFLVISEDYDLKLNCNKYCDLEDQNNQTENSTSKCKFDYIDNIDNYDLEDEDESCICLKTLPPSKCKKFEEITWYVD